jgi:hypothetical protein
MRPALRAAMTCLLLLGGAGICHAYSVLAHEAMVDEAWQGHIVPTLRQRFPRVTADQLRTARAYAYGGSLIHDLGYYPFGSRFFSDLLHYVRSGDFVETLVAEARDVNELAFALGALAHYTSDTFGHRIAVNRVVPILYPKLRAEYGTEVLYAESPARHVMVEFAFDVLQVGRGRFSSDTYTELIGFEVATPLLERAFRLTYGFELQDLFGDAELAIGTFRRASSTVIPDLTRAAWKEKQKEILAATPQLVERDIVYSMTRHEYEQAYGTRYRKPGLFARFIVFVGKIIPKVGPFRPLAFEPLTPPAAQLFLQSFDQAEQQYRAWLAESRVRRLALAARDLDTGEAVHAGANALADKTFGELLKRFDKASFAGLPVALRNSINAHYKGTTPDRRTAGRLTAMNNGVGSRF